MTTLETRPNRGKQLMAIHRNLKGAAYPADVHALLETARRNGADSLVLSAIEVLPDSSYRGPTDVSRAFASSSRILNSTPGLTK